MSRRSQPQRLPPPIMHDGEAIDSAIIVSEIRGDLGLQLWKTVRSVRLWSELGEGERSHAFDEGIHERRVESIRALDLPDAVSASLVKAAGVLQPRARAATVGEACRSIADWAAEEGALGTAIEFMQAAAVVLPESAELAREVGGLARTRTEFPRAETWYRQAISRARRRQDWYEFSRSYVALGNVYLLRGLYPPAKKNFYRGLRAAKRFSIGQVVAGAYHDLMALAIQTNRLPEATRMSQNALAAYGPGHPRLPALAFDYGVHLMQVGHFDAALRTFVAVPDGYGTPADQLARASSIVRSAGATGQLELYESELRNADILLVRPAAQTRASQALLSMARGAASIGDLELAVETANRSRQLALTRGEFETQGDAEAFLESAETAIRLDRGAKEELRPTPERVTGAVGAFESSLQAGAPA